MKTEQMERDIAFCIDELDLSNEQIGEILRACEQLGNISVEYFCEEFIFECDDLDALNVYQERIEAAKSNNGRWFNVSYSWGDGDSLDRERVRDIILESPQFSWSH